MTWLETVLQQLERGGPAGYRAGGQPCTEPTALAALALAAHGRTGRLRPLLRWLADRQLADGRLALSATEEGPGWVTPLAALAWVTGGAGAFARETDAALRWVLDVRGTATPRRTVPGGGPLEVGHDTSLVGWPWVPGTHSWVIPTAYCLLALKGTGRGHHPRTREAARLLVDRHLPGGGCNYGNPVVLGRELRPQVEPTGLAAAALRDEVPLDPRVGRSLDYLAREVRDVAAPASLAFAVLGLAAHDRPLADAPDRLGAAYDRRAGRGRAVSPKDAALLCLAGLGSASPLVPPRPRSSP